MSLTFSQTKELLSPFVEGNNYERLREALKSIGPQDEIILESSGDCQRGYILDVAIDMGDNQLIHKLYSKGGRTLRNTVIPFEGSHQWNLELLYYLLDQEIYLFDSDTPHGLFYAEGYRYLNNPLDFVHIVTYAYDEGVDVENIDSFLSEEGRNLLKNYEQSLDLHGNKLEFSEDHRNMAEYLTASDNLRKIEILNRAIHKTMGPPLTFMHSIREFANDFIFGFIGGFVKWALGNLSSRAQ